MNRDLPAYPGSVIRAHLERDALGVERAITAYTRANDVTEGIARDVLANQVRVALLATPLTAGGAS